MPPPPSPPAPPAPSMAIDPPPLIPPTQSAGPIRIRKPDPRRAGAGGSAGAAAEAGREGLVAKGGLRRFLSIEGGSRVDCLKLAEWQAGEGRWRCVCGEGMRA